MLLWACNNDESMTLAEECKSTNEQELTWHQITDVYREHRALFKRQPGLDYATKDDLIDDEGNRTGQVGIILYYFDEIPDQSALPPEDRVPHYLEGVPVQFISPPPKEEILPDGAKSSD